MKGNAARGGMDKTAVGAFLVAAAAAVFLVVGFIEEIPLAVGIVGGILLLIGLVQLLQGAPRYGGLHRGLVIAALVLTVLASLIFRVLLRNEQEFASLDDLETTLLWATLNDTMLALAALLGLVVVANWLERGLLALAVVLTVVGGLMAVASLNAFAETVDPVEEERHLADIDLWANVAIVGGNAPTILAGSLLGARVLRRGDHAEGPLAAPPSGSTAYAGRPATLAGAAAQPPVQASRSLTCPRCKTVVARPAAGSPVCPACGYPGPDARRPAGKA